MTVQAKGSSEAPFSPERGQESQALRRRARLRRRLGRIPTHLLVILAARAIGFPFYYMISTSLKTVS